MAATKLGLDDLAKQLEKMRVHRQGGRPSAYKPFLLLLAIRRLLRDPHAERLVSYDTIGPELTDLLERYGRGSSPRREHAFTRLGNEPFWEVRGPIALNASGDASASSLSSSEVRAGFTDEVQALLIVRENAEAMRKLLLDRWIAPDVRADVELATE